MHQIVQNIARHLVFPAMYSLGLQRVLSAFSSHDKLILCYHGVAHASSLPYNGRHLPADTFERHLRYFKRNFHTVTFSELFRLYQEDASPSKPTLALTFDDGYLNNLTHALPLLEQYEIPATFFVSTICLEAPSAVLWPDVIDVLRVGLGSRGIQIGPLDFQPRPGLPFRLYERGSGQSLYDYVKQLGVGERDKVLSELKQTYAFDELVEARNARYWQLMNREQVQQLAASPWAEIGSHAHRHYNLANIPAQDARYELTHSKALLEDLLQSPIHTLAFPDGNYNAEVKALAKEAGYDCLGALKYRLPDDKADPHILSRENISGTTNYYSQIIHLHQQMPKVGC